jgi:hypothetical protein
MHAIVLCVITKLMQSYTAIQFDIVSMWRQQSIGTVIVTQRCYCRSSLCVVRAATAVVVMLLSVF